jgi:hypothetical protein
VELITLGFRALSSVYRALTSALAFAECFRPLWLEESFCRVFIGLCRAPDSGSV